MSKQGRKNMFQMFFEKALGPPETPTKLKKKPSKQKEKTRESLPRVSFNPMIAMLGIQPKGMDWEKEFVAFPNTILKIDNNHFALNRVLENRELFSKSKLDYMDIKNMLSLDYEKGWQYKIILEGGLLLCQLREIHKERDNLVKHVRSFMKKAVKNRHDNFESLVELVDSVTPFSKDDIDTDNMPNPILPILVDALYNDLKKVKEAYQIAKEQTFMAEE